MNDYSLTPDLERVRDAIASRPDCPASLKRRLKGDGGHRRVYREFDRRPMVAYHGRYMMMNKALCMMLRGWRYVRIVPEACGKRVRLVRKDDVFKRGCGAVKITWRDYDQGMFYTSPLNIPNHTYAAARVARGVVFVDFGKPIKRGRGGKRA